MNDTSGVLFWVPDSPTDIFIGKRERERGEERVKAHRFGRVIRVQKGLNRELCGLHFS